MSETMRNIGLGIILMKVRFSVSVAKVHNGFGFTTAMYVEMKNMTDHQRLAIQLWCDENDLPVKYRANKWVLANPIPTSKRDEWTDFYDWVQLWDDFNENGELN